ncbi:MAG: tripartite tricarboxylate transporter substrate binding protein [Thermodesulfobacteriota bacterium]
MKRRTLATKAAVLACGLLLVLGGVFWTSSASAETYPDKPIKLICPYGAGGTTDLAARTLSAAIPEFLGQPVVVINRPGASGSIAFDFMTKQKPTGYTMFMAAIGTNAMYTAMNPNLPFKWSDLVYVARTQINPNMLVVSAKSPWKTFQDFAKDLKAHPGKYKYSTAGPGVTSHLGAVLILEALGLPLNAAHAVHYNSDGQAVLAVIQGEVDFFQANLAPMDGHVKSGLVRGLAVTTKERLPDHKGVPTYTELGYPSVNVIGWRGVCGPPGTPPAVIKAWEAAVKKTVASKYWRTVVTKFGDVPGYMDSKEFTKYAGEEFKRYRALFAKLGLLMKKK